MLHTGGLLLCLLCLGGLLPCLLHTGGLLPCLLCRGGLLLRLVHPGGLQSCLLRPGGFQSRLLHPGGLQFRPLRTGVLQFSKICTLCRVLFSILLVLATYQDFHVCFLCSVSCIVLRLSLYEPFLVFVSYFSLSLFFSCCLVVWILIFYLVYWINPVPSIWTLFAPAWTIACVPGLPIFSSPLDIVRQSKTMHVYLSTHLPRPQYTCLPFVRPCLWFWPCLLIKACTSIRTPHVSFSLLHQAAFYWSQWQIHVTCLTTSKICMRNFFALMLNSRSCEFLLKWLDFAREISPSNSKCGPQGWFSTKLLSSILSFTWW